MKRFYETVSVRAVQEGGYGVMLDARPVLTPARARLVMPNARLARAVAGEWAAQGEAIKPHTMPMTRLAATALDRVRPDPGGVVDALMQHVDADMLCYRAAGPRELVERQNRVWQPLLDWAALALDARLGVTTGVLPVPQPASARAALRAALESRDVLSLAGVQALAAASGSLVLALAVAEGRIEGEQAADCALLDETYQSEVWGEDTQALERRAEIREDILAATAFLRLCR